MFNASRGVGAKLLFTALVADGCQGGDHLDEAFRRHVVAKMAPNFEDDIRWVQASAFRCRLEDAQNGRQ